MYWWENQDKILQPPYVLNLSYKTFFKLQIDVVAQHPKKVRKKRG
jgi:hypothetical protein